MKNTYIYVPNKNLRDKVIATIEHCIHNQLISVIDSETSNKYASVACDEHITISRDFIPSALRGILLGACLGIITSIFLTIYSQDLMLGKIGVSQSLVITLLFSVLGAFFSSMIGVSVKHPDIAHFNKYLKAGGYLIVVRVKSLEEANECKKIISENFPQSKIIIDKFLKVNNKPVG